jgi:hypothetical protein
MTTSNLVRSPAVRRSGATLAAAFLLAAGAQQASATPSASGSNGSSGSSAASTCPDQVHVTLGRMSVSGGMVTISFTHTGHGCPSAQPASLHVHQNLLSEPRAGSDPEHQWNADFAIGPEHSDGVTVPLLASADGKCFVQVDARVSGQRRGQFFPTTTCTSASPSSTPSSSPVPSSTAPSSSASSSTASSSAASSSAASSSAASSSAEGSSTARTSSVPSTSAAPSTTSQSALPESTSRSSAASTSFFPVAQVTQPPSGGSLASTGSRTVLPVGLGALLAVVGAWLVNSSRRPRRH